MQQPQILVTERCGSLGRTVHYIKKQDDTIQKSEAVGSLPGTFFQYIKDFLREIFLPYGYPESVSSDYYSYQIWDTIQAFCSTITGTLTTRAILKGVGVGNENATPVAAAITWIVKDGTGMIGRIVFAWWKGNVLDGDCKKWRLCADILNDLAMFLELLVPKFDQFTIQILCMTTAMKSVVGVAGAATRASITQHQAIRGNMADVSAKDGSQETFVNLIASLFGILLLSFVTDEQYEWLAFCGLTFIHIFANYLAVSSLIFSHLNETRLVMILKTYLRYDTVPSAEKINRSEPVLLGRGSKIKDLCSFDIKMGHSLKKIVTIFKGEEINVMSHLYKDKKYMLIPDIEQRTIYIALQHNEGPEDVIAAYFHAVLLAVMICKVKDIRMNVSAKRQLHHPTPISRLQNAMKAFPRKDITSNLSALPLMQAFENFAFQEIVMFFTALKINNWNTEAHALDVGPWRCEWKTREIDFVYKKET